MRAKGIGIGVLAPKQAQNKLRHRREGVAVHHLEAGCRPPNNVAAVPARIDAPRYLAGGVFDFRMWFEQQMPAAAAGDMRARHRQIGV